MMQRYLLICPQTHTSFRLPEIKAVVELVGANVQFCETHSGVDPAPPFIVVTCDSATGIEAVVQRSVCIHQCIEIWGEGETWDECHTAVRAHPDANKTPYTCDGSTFKLDFLCRGRKFSNTLKQSLMKSISTYSFHGKVDLKEPDHIFYFVEDTGIVHGVKSTTLPSTSTSAEGSRTTTYFGRLVACGARDLINRINLKDRNLIGNTSMDPELSIIAANMCKVARGMLVVDPFVGTGSILYPCAHYGAYVTGCDINKAVLHGLGKTSRANPFHKMRGDNENIAATMAQYGLSDQFLGVWLVDQARHCWRRPAATPQHGDDTSTPPGTAGLFDAIVTDPPYGIREGARTMAATPADGPAAPDNYWMRHESHVYERDTVFGDLLAFAAQFLVLHGRLAYWLPVIKGEYSEDQVPVHPCLSVVANCEQPLSGRMARRLITMQKTRAWTHAMDPLVPACTMPPAPTTTGSTSAAVPPPPPPLTSLSFRDKYFAPKADAAAGAERDKPSADPVVRVEHIPGFTWTPDAVTEDVWQRLRTWMATAADIPWATAREGRRVVQYGFCYDYAKQCVDLTPVAPIPPLLLECFPAVRGHYEQCIINEYEANQSIPYHTDDGGFGPSICVFVFGDARPLRFRRRVAAAGTPNAASEGDVPTDATVTEMHRFKLTIPHRAQYLLEGEARYKWEHCITEGAGLCYRTCVVSLCGAESVVIIRLML
eukprot:m.531545 g.531545  ORF g.531545 m.531545 type:complete len:712 (-) comp22037_c0_seq5:123-2258(-)